MRVRRPHCSEGHAMESDAAQPAPTLQPASATPPPAAPKAPIIVSPDDLSEIVLGCASLRPFYDEVMEKVKVTPEPFEIPPPRRNRQRRHTTQPQPKGTGVYVFGLANSGCVTVEGGMEAAQQLAAKLNQRFRALMLVELGLLIDAIPRPPTAKGMSAEEVLALRQSLSEMKSFDRDWVVARAGSRHSLPQIVPAYFGPDLIRFSGADAKERVVEMEAQFHRVRHELIVPIQVEWQKRLAASLPTNRHA